MEYDTDTLYALKRAVRAADKEFEMLGGSSRHWMIECFLPALEDEGLEITDTRSQEERERARRAPGGD